MNSHGIVNGATISCAIVNSHGIVNGATISVFEHISNDEIELVDEMKPVDFKPVSHKIRLVTHS